MHVVKYFGGLAYQRYMILRRTGQGSVGEAGNKSDYEKKKRTVKNVAAMTISLQPQNIGVLIVLNFYGRSTAAHHDYDSLPHESSHISLYNTSKLTSPRSHAYSRKPPNFDHSPSHLLL